MDDDEKKCVVCNKDAMLALFGIGIGVLFVLMGLDTLRRMRRESTVDAEVVDND